MGEFAHFCLPSATSYYKVPNTLRQHKLHNLKPKISPYPGSSTPAELSVLPWRLSHGMLKITAENCLQSPSGRRYEHCPRQRRHEYRIRNFRLELKRFLARKSPI